MGKTALQRGWSELKQAMNTLRSRKQEGSVLLVTLVTCVILGSSLAAYLEYARQESAMVYRSQTWNMVMPACEAGVEDALALLNRVQSGERGVYGWSSNGTTVSMSRTIGDFRYVVSITAADPPVVTSTGYMKAPVSTNEISRTIKVTTTKSRTGMFGLVAKGSIHLGPGSVVDSWNSAVSGAYRSAVVKSNAFVGAVHGSIAGQGGSSTTIKGDVATGPTGTISAITFTGASSQDLNMSFPDVADPFNPGSAFTPTGGTLTVTNYTTGYQTNTTSAYHAPGTGENVYTNVVTITNTAVPAAPTVFSTFVGNITNSSPPTVGTPFNVLLGSPVNNTVSLPANINGFTTYRNSVLRPNGRYDYDPVTHWRWSATLYVYNTTNYTYVSEQQEVDSVENITYKYILSSENYLMASMSLTGHDEVLVRGHAKLWITESLSMSGQARITILPGASLELYGGTSSGTGAGIDIAGNGVLNMSGDSAAMSVFGLPTAKEVYIRGNGEFVGSIYAPNATLYGKGGGADVQDVQGAAVMGEVSFNGHVNFHYDEKLGDNSGITQWRISSWLEQ